MTKEQEDNIRKLNIEAEKMDYAKTHSNCCDGLILMDEGGVCSKCGEPCSDQTEDVERIRVLKSEEGPNLVMDFGQADKAIRFYTNNEEILRLDSGKFYCKGIEIEDVNKVYEAFTAWIGFVTSSYRQE